MRTIRSPAAYHVCYAAADATAPAQAADCDRACLSGLLTQYVDALVAHDPSRLPVAGEVQIPRDTLDRAKIRILTLTFDGQRRNSAVYYDIPVAQFINKTPAAAPPLALPPAKKVAR